MHILKKLISKRLVRTLSALSVLFFMLVALTYTLVSVNSRYVHSLEDAPHTRIGIVLGSGVDGQGKPYKELKARLDAAADALDRGVVDKLLLSGDNRYLNYNEPTAMKNYLVTEKGIASSKLVEDFAGRSTYESCERAAKIFGVTEATIFSAGFHLPRAIYLCRHFGIETYGIANSLEPTRPGRRETPARIKAIYNVYIKGEPTILGNPIDM